MAVAAEALLKLRTVFDGDGISRASRAIGELQRQAGSSRTPLGRVTKGLDAIDRGARSLATKGLIGAGIGLGVSAQRAIAFETALTDVRKAVGQPMSSDMMKALNKDFIALSRTIPLSASELANIGATGAFAGKQTRQEILDFTKTVAEMSVAFKMPAEEASTAFTAIQSSIGLTDRETVKLLDTVNRLSDALPGRVEAKDIVEGFTRGIGSMGKMAGLKPQDSAGLYSAFLASGNAPEVAATGMKNFLNALVKGSDLTGDKQDALARLFGTPIDPVRKQLNDEYNQLKKEIAGGIDGVSQSRADAIDKLIDDAKYQGKKFIEFEGRTLNFTQAAIIKKRLGAETSEYTKGLKNRMKEIESTLKTMPSPGGQVAEQIKRSMQIDARGTIQSVLKQFQKVPAAERPSLLATIFGEEGKLAIGQIIGNPKLVADAFKVSADVLGSAGSMQKEYAAQLDTTASKLKLFRNGLDELAITVGQSAVLPLLNQGMKELLPLIQELIPVIVDLAKSTLPLLLDGLKFLIPQLRQFAAWAKENTATIKMVAGAFLGFVALSTVGRVVFGLVKGFMDLVRVLRLLGGLSKTVMGGLGGLGGIGKGGPGGGLGGLLGPLMGGGPKGGGGAGGLLATIRGWFGSAMAAVGPLASSLGGALARAAGTIGAMMRGGLARIGNPLKMFFDTLRGFTPQMVMKDGQWVKPLAVKLAEGLRGAFSGLGNIGAGGMGGLLPRLGQGVMSLLPVLATVGRAVLAFFSGPVGWITLLATAAIAAYAFRDKLAPIFQVIGGFWNTYVVTPIRTGWANLMTWLGERIRLLAQNQFAPLIVQMFAGGQLSAQLAQSFAGISTFFNTYVITPIRAGWTALVGWFGTTMTSVGGGLAAAWLTISTFFNTYVITPLRAMWQGFVFYVLQTIQAYAIVWWQGVTAGFQTYVVIPITGAWNWLITQMGMIGAQLSQIWITVATNFQTYVVIPLQQLWTGFTTWLGTSIIYLQGLFSGIWNGIAINFQTYVLTPIQQGWGMFTTWFYQSAGTLRTWLMGLWQGVSQNFYNWVVVPIQQGWGGLVQWLSGTVGSVRSWFGTMWNGVAQGFSTQIAQPVQQMWAAVLQFVQQGWSNTTSWFYGMFASIGAAFNDRLVRPIYGAFQGFISGIQGLISGLFGWLQSVGNGIIGRINRVRQAAGFRPIPGFATGGYVNGPTLAWVGEGRDSEYIIPSSKMAGASMAFLSGARGPAVLSGANNIRGFAKGGYVGGTGLPELKKGEVARRKGRKPNQAMGAATMKASSYGEKTLPDRAVAPSMMMMNVFDNKKKKPSFGFSSGFTSLKANWKRILSSRPAYADDAQRWGAMHGVMFDAKQWHGFASGGYVRKPTLGLVGEGKDPGEYIIPSSKMAGASMAYLGGARGPAVLRAPAFAQGGYVGQADRSGSPLQALLDRMSPPSVSPRRSNPPSASPINITTGPVLQFQGDDYVKRSDLERVARDVQRQTLGALRTPAGRRATGRL